MKNIYVTGASGFLASELCKYLQALSLPVVAVSRKKLASTGYSFIHVNSYSDLKPEAESICIHLAETSQISKVNNQSIDQQREQLLSILSKPFSKIVYASSAAVYGDKSKVRHSEADTRNIDFFISEYQRGKLENEKILLSDSRPNLALRFSNIYGLRMSSDSVLMAIWSQIMQEVKIVNLRSLCAVRDFLHVKDANNAIYKAIEVATVSGIYNIASGEELAIKELAELCLRLSNKSYVQLKADNKENSFSYLALDITKAQRELSWSPKIRLEDGLKSFYQELKEFR